MWMKFDCAQNAYPVNCQKYDYMACIANDPHVTLLCTNIVATHSQLSRLLYVSRELNLITVVNFLIRLVLTIIPLSLGNYHTCRCNKRSKNNNKRL